MWYISAYQLLFNNWKVHPFYTQVPELRVASNRCTDMHLHWSMLDWNHTVFTLCCIHAEEKPLVETFYIASIWCFMTFKWSMLLLSNAIMDDRSPKDSHLGSVEGDSESEDSLLPDVNPTSP